MLITSVNRCSGIDGTWGHRAADHDLAQRVARPLGEAIDAVAAEVVTGDCRLADGSIFEETGIAPVHPMQFLSRAYGTPEEPDR